MPTPSVIKQYQYSDAINRREWDNRYLFDNFAINPVTSKLAGGAATGTAGDTNIMFTQFGMYEYCIVGTQTAVAPVIDTFGLNLTMTGTSGQGIEVTAGRTALCPYAFTVGTDPAFAVEAFFKVQDASGCNPLVVGFLKAQAFATAISSYTDYAMIGIIGTGAAIETQTNLNSAGAVTTDTTQTWADGATNSLKVLVSSTGVVTYQINSQAPTVTAAFTFNTGDVLIPFFRFVEAADVTTQASINYLECGFQS